MWHRHYRPAFDVLEQRRVPSAAPSALDIAAKHHGPPPLIHQLEHVHDQPAVANPHDDNHGPKDHGKSPAHDSLAAAEERDNSASHDVRNNSTLASSHDPTSAEATSSGNDGTQDPLAGSSDQPSGPTTSASKSKHTTSLTTGEDAGEAKSRVLSDANLLDQQSSLDALRPVQENELLSSRLALNVSVGADHAMQSMASSPGDPSVPIRFAASEQPAEAIDPMDLLWSGLISDRPSHGTTALDDALAFFRTELDEVGAYLTHTLSNSGYAVWVEGAVALALALELTRRQVDKRRRRVLPTEMATDPTLAWYPGMPGSFTLD